MSLLSQIASGRTDLIFDHLAAGHPANSTDQNGVSLIQWCAYYGDVSAIKLLLSKGESLESLGDDFGLNNACFHGHWRLCQFLLENGADVDRASPETGETPLHSALSKTWPECTLVVNVLLGHGANPNVATKPGVETSAFMRDVRTKGETPLHRAAAFADEEAIQLLLDAGAKMDAKDMNGDSPLSWASWHLRPDSILRKLCYGNFRINPDRKDIKTYLRGEPKT
jgi:palmitoyltransferase